MEKKENAKDGSMIKMIPPKEFGFIVGLSHRSVLEYIRLGKLNPHRVPGRRPYFTQEDVEEVLANGFPNSGSRKSKKKQAIGKKRDRNSNHGGF